MYTYDNNGNTVSRTTSAGTTNYTWDFENRLASVTLPGTGGTVNFEYDPFGRRIYKSSSAGTNIYVYDGANVTQELNGAGSVVAQYTQGYRIDEPLALYQGSTTSYFQADGLGSITSLTNPAGTVAASYVYDAFGNLTASTGTISNPFQYTGREFDSETGLYYYRARYYDPTSGRFVSEDPKRFLSDVNFYRYVLNNPVLYVDPFGLLCACTFSISTGNFQCIGFGNLRYINASGYSGYGYAKNNLAETDLPGRDNPRQGGPIPLGTWIFGEGFNSRRRGNPSFNLTATQDVLIPPGRSGATGSFMIHADSSAKPGTASEGCIALDPESRRKLSECHGGTLSVIP